MNQEARNALEKSLPAATLIVGSPDDGWQLAEYAIRCHQVHPASVLRIGQLSAEAARGVAGAARNAPGSDLVVVVICLDKATEQAQNILLKALEEAPDSVRFILFTGDPVLATVSSRCQLLRIGWGEPVHAALDAQVPGSVGAALRCCAARDTESLLRLAPGWTARHSLALASWAREASSGRWREFGAGFAPQVTREQAASLWRLVAPLPDSPPTALAALHRVFWGTSS